MSKIGALVAYKGRPAQVISSTTHKYEISFSDGSSQKVREKDFRFIHPEFASVHSDCPEVDISILNDCLLYTSPSPRDAHESRMPSSA